MLRGRGTLSHWIFVARLIGFRRRRCLSISNDVGAQMKDFNDRGEYRKTLDLFRSNLNERQRTTLAVNQALKASIELGDLQQGEAIHRSLSPYMIKNSFIRTNLIRLYLKFGEVQKSKEIFDQTVNKTLPMYNNLLHGLADHERADEGLRLFEQMTNNERNEFTYSAVLKICEKIGDRSALNRGETIFQSMPKKYQQNPVLLVSFLQMLIMCGDLRSAEHFFNRIEKKNVFFYGIMMKGFLTNRMPKRAIELFEQVDKADVIIYTIFFNACAQLANDETLVLGKEVFSRLPSQFRQSTKILSAIFNLHVQCADVPSAEALFVRLDRDVISYGLLMKLLNNDGQPEKTLKLFEQMKDEGKITPNEIIFTLLLNACSLIGDLSLAEQIVAQIPLRNAFIDVSLIDLWGKVGSVDKARLIFEKIEHPNIVCQTAMINAYARNGLGQEAFQLFDQTPREMLDQWIYVCVLNACSHSGLMDQGWTIFSSIPIKERDERIYTAMIDGFSRAASFDQAQQLIREYEHHHSPSIPMYMSILSGARNMKHSALAQQIFDRMETNFPDDENALISARLLLANTFASNGNEKSASTTRMTLNQSRTKKVVGLAWTVANGRVFKFRAHDRSHPQWNEIEQELHRLANELNKRSQRERIAIVFKS